jgi:uncharacterized membrane protein
MTNEIDSASRTTTGVTPGASILVAYLLGWVGGLIFVLVEKQNRSVRFHAIQSIALSIALLAVLIVFQLIALVPVVGFVFSSVIIPIVGLGFLALIAIIVYQKYNGVDVQLPKLGEIAERTLQAM